VPSPGFPPTYGYAPPGPPGRYPYPQPPPGYVFVPMSPGGQPLASFGERLGAYVLDMLLYTAVAIVLMVPMFALLIAVWVPSMEAAESGTADGDAFFVSFGVLLLLQGAFLVVLLGLLYLYHVEYVLRTGGQTLGKKALKLRIVPVDPRAGLDRSMVGKRYLAQFVGGFIIPGFSYLDGLWQLWDKPFRQCLHDKFGQTVVIKVTGQ
jgi:uncharacterized RDD family membrane protein YckC